MLTINLRRSRSPKVNYNQLKCNFPFTSDNMCRAHLLDRVWIGHRPSLYCLDIARAEPGRESSDHSRKADSSHSDDCCAHKFCGNEICLKTAIIIPTSSLISPVVFVARRRRSIIDARSRIKARITICNWWITRTNWNLRQTQLHTQQNHKKHIPIEDFRQIAAFSSRYNESVCFFAMVTAQHLRRRHFLFSLFRMILFTSLRLSHGARGWVNFFVVFLHTTVRFGIKTQIEQRFFFFSSLSLLVSSTLYLYAMLHALSTTPLHFCGKTRSRFNFLTYLTHSREDVE